MHRLPLLAALLATPVAAQASNIHRCEDDTGHVTFTSLGCQTDQHSESVEAYNAPPGSVALPLLPARERALPRELVVVGQRDDGCGNRLSAQQRRQAIINQRTPPGMTRRDVESLLGRPDRISQRNGELIYHYRQKNGRSNQVAFDQDGCVKAKR